MRVSMQIRVAAGAIAALVLVGAAQAPAARPAQTEPAAPSAVGPPKSKSL